MASLATDARTDVRRVIEPHMRFLDESVHPLPRQLFAALGVVAQRLNPSVIRIAEIFMTRHAEIDAWNTGPRAAVHARMALVALDSNLVNLMNLMGKVDRLLWFGLYA
jgi:hypothetical protein